MTDTDTMHEDEMIELYRQLTPEQKQAYIVFLRTLIAGLNPDPPTLDA